jgi:hypothetical protein
MCHKRRMQAKADACGCDLEDDFKMWSSASQQKNENIIRVFAT